MKKIVERFLFCWVFSTISLCALADADRNEINTIVEHFTIAWNHYEGVGSANYYAEDADFINIFGSAFSGKEEIESRHVEIHKTFLMGSTFEVLDVKLREVKLDAVIVQVYWRVTMPLKVDSKLAELKGIFTHTFIKYNDLWKIVSTQNTLIRNES